MRKGYTLIEVLIALAVFAILAAMTGSVMHHAFTMKERIADVSSQMNRLQLALAMIEKDAQQATDRPVRIGNLQQRQAFIGKPTEMELTRSGLVNPQASEKRSTLKRIAYLCRQGQLIRRSWSRLDTPTPDRYEDAIILDNLKQCSLAYLNRKRQMQAYWHEKDMAKQDDEPLPVAIQLTLNVASLGELSLLFIIPEALYHEAI